jgi:hypothetical protein
VDKELSKPNSKCPVCKLDLGPHPEHYLRPDPVLESIIQKLIPKASERGQHEISRPIKKQKVDNSRPKQKGESIPFRVLIDENWIKEQEFEMPTDLHDALAQLPILKVDKNTTIGKLKVL